MPASASDRTRRDTLRFYLWHVGLPALLAMLLLVVFEVSNLDRRLSDLFFDPASMSFLWRHDVWMETIGHQWAKYPLVLLAVGLLVALALSVSLAMLRAQRKIVLFLLLSMALAPAAVSFLKTTTNKHCPYDLQIYGGNAPYVRLLEQSPPDAPPGHCFPGGHASGGFALMAFYFIWRRRRPYLAFGALAGGFSYGFALGFTRLMQGAHFLSHNLWAAVVCWFVIVILYRLLLWDKRPEVLSQP
jgi:membrane-associated PAP2 superfamily phosphatase